MTNSSDDFCGKYSKEEFFSIISLLPRVQLQNKLIEYAQGLKGAKKTTRLQKYVRFAGGFRPNDLKIEKIQEIFYSVIYDWKSTDSKRFATDLQIMIAEYMKKIDQNIADELDSPKSVRSRIEENDMVEFEKLVNLLLKQNLEDNISLYFKMIDLKLTDEQEYYIGVELIRIIEYKKIEKEVETKISESHGKIIMQLEDEYRKRILERENEIVQLEKRIDDIVYSASEEVKILKVKIDELENRALQLKEIHAATINSYEEKNDLMRAVNEEYSKQIVKCQSDIELLTEVLEERHRLFDEIAKEKWERDSGQLLAERKLAEAHIQKILAEKKKLSTEIEVLYQKRSELENEYLFFENGIGEFINRLQKFTGFLNMSIEDRIAQDMHLIVSDSSIKMSSEETKSSIDFISDLSENLSVCGIDNEYATDLAQYIFATLSNRMCLLLVGYHARPVANALSSVIDAQQAGIIALPLGYSDAHHLIKIVKRMCSNVVLIENAVDNVNENIYLQLIKASTEKTIVFSMESSEHLNLLSESLLNYMMLVDLDSLIGGQTNSDNLIYSLTNKDVFQFQPDISSCKHNLRHLKGLEKVISLGNVANLKIAEVMSSIDKLHSQNAMYDIIIFSLLMQSRCKGKLEELLEFINEQDFPPITLKALYSILGKSADYE